MLSSLYIVSVPYLDNNLQLSAELCFNFRITVCTGHVLVASIPVFHSHAAVNTSPDIFSALLCPQAFAVCSIVFVIYRALKWCSFNLDILNKQLLAVHQLVIQKELKFQDLGFEDQLIEKRDIYIKLRMVIAMYTMVFAIITTMSTFLSEYMYVKVLSFEIPEFLVYASVGYIFKLGDFSRFENIEVVVPQENSVIIFLPYPVENWPKRQKLVLGIPLENASVEVIDEEKKSLLEER